MCQTDINSALAGVPEDTYNKGQNSYLKDFAISSPNLM